MTHTHHTALRIVVLASGSGTLLQSILDNQGKYQVVGVVSDVVSAGFMKILGAPFLSRFGGRTINTHPALLPAFPGAHAVRDALAYGVKVTGSTVHFVDAGVDTGPIIAQEPVAIMPGESESDLHERIKQVERKLIVNVLNSATVAADNQGEVDFANHE